MTTDNFSTLYGEEEEITNHLLSEYYAWVYVDSAGGGGAAWPPDISKFYNKSIDFILYTQITLNYLLLPPPPFLEQIIWSWPTGTHPVYVYEAMP